MSKTFDQGRDEIIIICKYFATNRQAFFAPGVKEAHIRQNLIDPFFEALGWDMRNAAMVAPQYREVVTEDSLEIEGQQKAQHMQRKELFEITGDGPAEISKDRAERRRLGEYDTIVCPAHPEGFDEEFLGKNRWYAIRLSKKVIPNLKYIAIYVTSPHHKITHYGRIDSVKPYQDSGKYMIKLCGKAKAIGPIVHSPGISMQGSHLALMENLKNARTLAEPL